MKTRFFHIGIILIATLVAMPVLAEELSVEKVTDRVHMIQGAVGNITVIEGGDGLLVVDSGITKTSDQVAAKLTEISSKPMRYLVNTHYHFDHVGGNAIFGRGATIIAHKNCRNTMTANLKPEETPDGVGVPQETYDSEKTVKIGEQIVKLLHLGPAHTSGDTIVVSESEKVVVAGDTFFNGMPPYIDVKNGSDTANWVTLIGKLAERYPEYKVVPGHGPVTDMAGYQAFAKYLSALREKVKAAVEAGKSREETMESVKLDEFAEIADNDFLKKSENVGWVYDEMTR
jgi:glyoxylase-like metal-dependent hydrolase (beta-lactamase superfamily II)